MYSPSQSPLPPLPMPSLWVFPVHQPGALVSCIQPGLVICFTLDNIHVSMLFSQNLGEFYYLAPVNVLGVSGQPTLTPPYFEDHSLTPVLAWCILFYFIFYLFFFGVMYFNDLKVTLRSAHQVPWCFSPCVTNKAYQEMALWVNFSPTICIVRRFSPRTQVKNPETKLSFLSYWG